MRFVYLIACILCCVQFKVLSQDIIYVQGDKRVKGKVLTYFQDSLLVYQNKKGNTFEVHKKRMPLIKELVIRGKSLPNKKSYYLLQTGLGLGSDGQTYANPEFRLAYGRKINQYLQPGIGLGYDFYDDYNLMPIFMNLHGVFSNTLNTGFYNAKIGYGSALRRKQNSLEFENLKGGASYEFEIGTKTYFQNTYFLFSIGYKHQHSENKQLTWGNRLINEKLNYRRFTLRVGIGI